MACLLRRPQKHLDLGLPIMSLTHVKSEREAGIDRVDPAVTSITSALSDILLHRPLTQVLGMSFSLEEALLCFNGRK